MIEEKLQQADILTSKETTFTKYTDDLLRFQDVIVPIVMGDDYIPGMRVEEAIVRMQSTARSKGLIGDPTVMNGIKSLKTVNKELHICMAGRKGENLVAKTLEYVSRPEVKVYRNVYLTDGKDETELDAVVTTDSGVIILEIKKTKDDLTITKDGRLVHSGDECYEKKPISEKMRTKRRLLKERLDLECARKGFSTPVMVDSYIVFVTPKGIRINIEDNYKEEKWCFRTSLNHRINGYMSDVYYPEEQIDTINYILGDLECQKKSFVLDIDYVSVAKDFADAMGLLNQEDDYDNKKPEWKDKVINAAKGFKNSPTGKAIITTAPYIIFQAAGPVAGVIGKAFPKAAPVASKVAIGIRAASRV